MLMLGPSSSTLSFITLLLVFISTIIAAPSPSFSSYSRNVSSGFNKTIIARQDPNSYFTPPTTFETLGAGTPLNAKSGNPNDLIAAAQRFLVSKLPGDSDSDWKTSGARVTATDMYTHVYFNKMLFDIPIINAVAHVVIRNGDKKIIAYSGTWSTRFGSVSQMVGPPDDNTAYAAAEKFFGAGFARVPNSYQPMAWYASSQDKADLVVSVQVSKPNGDQWRIAFVHIVTKQVFASVDMNKHSSYTVVPIHEADPGAGLVKVNDPEEPATSPDGWHRSNGGNPTFTTEGNHANVYQMSSNSRVPLQQSSATFNFNFNYDTSKDVTFDSNWKAASTNAFYVVNTMHDFSYRYGFTETMFNFQGGNFKKGGKENDAVQVALFTSTEGFTPNHNFATPPDGFAPRMNLYINPGTTPQRHGAMSNDILIHEYTHGITNRMIGGGTGLCLIGTEREGLGEGWSDAIAFFVAQKDANVRDFTFGSYAVGNSKGMRRFPYSTNFGTNALKYSSVVQSGNAHEIGEVWANILVNVYAGLVADFGFNRDAMTKPDGKEGNIVFMHLLMDGLVIQECNPIFQHARDAIIQADVSRYNGAHRCTLWRGFASRGLGLHADNFRDNSDVPSDCPSVPPPTATRPTVPFNAPVPALPPPLPTTTMPTVPFEAPVPALPPPPKSTVPFGAPVSAIPKPTVAPQPPVVNCPFWFPDCADD